MSKKEIQLAELSLLMEALCEERLSTEQQDRLEEITLSDPDAMQFYLNYSHLHGTLHWDQALGSDAMIPVVSPISETELSEPVEIPEVPRRNRVRAGLAATCLLVFLAVVFIALLNRVILRI